MTENIGLNLSGTKWLPELSFSFVTNHSVENVSQLIQLLLTDTTFNWIEVLQNHRNSTLDFVIQKPILGNTYITLAIRLQDAESRSTLVSGEVVRANNLFAIFCFIILFPLLLLAILLASVGDYLFSLLLFAGLSTVIALYCYIIFHRNSFVKELYRVINRSDYSDYGILS